MLFPAALAGLLLLASAGCGSPDSTANSGNGDSNATTETTAMDSDCEYVLAEFEKIRPELERRAPETNPDADIYEWLAGVNDLNRSQELVSGWAATTWPNVEDADLKSALRAIANGINANSNLQSVNSICGWT